VPAGWSYSKMTCSVDPSNLTRSSRALTFEMREVN
jgi:hypothetical protein